MRRFLSFPTLRVVAGGALALLAACHRDRPRAPELAKADTLIHEAKYHEAVEQTGRVLRRDVNSSDAHRLAGEAQLELGQIAAAYQHLLKAQVLAPTRSDIRADLARLYLVTGNTSAARDHALSILDRDPHDIMGLLLLGATASTKPQIDDAVHRLEVDLSRFGQDPRPRLVLASLYQRNGDAAKAAQYHKEAGGTDSVSAVQKAQSYLLYGERAQAKAALQSVVANDRDSTPVALRFLAELALADSNATLAEETAKRVLQKDSLDIEASLQLGRALLQQQKTADAIALFERVLLTDAGIAPAHFYLGSALVRANRFSDARQQLEQAIKLTSNYPEAVSQFGRLNAKSDIPRATIDDADRQVKLNPHSLEARRVLGEALIGAGRANEADEVFRSAARLAPDRPEPHYWLAVSLSTQKLRDGARGELATALKLSPAFAEAMAQLVAMDLADGKGDSALARVNEQLRVVPQSAALYDILGSIRMARNERDAAVAAFERSAQLDPRLPNPRGHLANLYVLMQRYDLAIAQGEVARKLDPQNEPTLLALGVAYQSKGDVARARDAYQAALAVDPNSTAAANNLAFLLSETSSDQDEAMRYAFAALKVSPNDPHIKDTAGWILYKARRYEDALTLLRESAKALPTAPAVQYHYGIVAQRTGDFAAARKALELAVAAKVDYPGKEDARKALSLLK